MSGRPLRVLHLLDVLRYSGAETAFRVLGPMWAAHGITCDVLATGPELGEYIRARHPRSKVDNAPLDPAVIASAQETVARRRAEKEAASGAMVDVMSEA